MKNTKLSPPWLGYVEQIKALFSEDPEITLGFDDDKMSLRLYVDNTDKAEALSELLPDSVQFGNVELDITVVPANKDVANTKGRLFDLAFRGNPIVTDIVDIEGAFSNPMTFVEFRKEVVQYYNDDLSDLHGNRSTLYQEIAKEVFGDTEGIFFCTDNEEEE